MSSTALAPVWAWLKRPMPNAKVWWLVGAGFMGYLLGAMLWAGKVGS